MSFRPLAISCGLACAASALPAHAQEPRPVLRVARPVTAEKTVVATEITPPPTVVARAPASSVTLKPESSGAIIKSLTVLRRFSLPQLRAQAQPVITLGTAKINMRPVLDNPAALINLAGRMKERPQLVTVAADSAEVVQVKQGLVVRQFVSYRVAPGVCSNPDQRQQLERSGGNCATRVLPAARAAAFADPKDPYYVADPGKRAQALAAADKQAAQEQADLTSGVAQFRAQMANPAQRAQIEAQLGAAEAQRLASMSDADLEEEAVNSAQVEVEDTMFVPTASKLDLRIRPTVHMPGPTQLHLPQKVDVNHSLKDHILLTGFTLGRQYEWRRRVSITVNTCLVSCKKTYYVEVYAGFDYGFGLRFPIKVGGLYSYHREGTHETATIAPVFVPINGSAGDYASTGLDSSKIFSGKEVVAQADAYAGMNLKLPFFGTHGFQFKVGADLTKDLPAPFTDGQFAPPAPGDPNPPEVPVIFPQPDLLGGYGNYGVAGAKVLPAVKVGLVSHGLKLKLTDDLAHKTFEMESSGQPYPLKVDPSDHSSHFSIGDPRYNLAFKVTPGIDARLFVDVAVWSHHWDWPIWFPQIALTLPPEGVTFTCHEGTVCSYDYIYSPTDAKDKQGDLGPPPTQLEQEAYYWRVSFQKKWFAICPSMPLQFCQAGILSLAHVTENQMVSEMQALPKYPSKESAMIVLKKAIEADKKAKAIVLESKVALIDRRGKELFKAYEPVWNAGCADQLCRDNIHKLGGPYAQALMARQEANPDKGQDEIVSAENTAGRWAQKAHAEVLASQRRTGRLQPQLRVAPRGARVIPGGN
jgi:hypothetical protein